MGKKRIPVAYETNGYDRVREGNLEHVRKYEKEIEVPELDEATKEKITKGKAKKLFEKRSERSKKMDIQKDARKMFAVPNLYWANNINRTDLWGIDGFNAPEVEELPTDPLPFEIMKLNGILFCADSSGKFRISETKVKQIKELTFKDVEARLYKIRSPEEWTERFEKEEQKNAIWHNKITKGYESWLTKEYQFEVIADKLDPTDPTNKLYQILEYYEKLNLREKDLKKVMFKLYNQIYARQIKDYTKKFDEFYEHGFYNKIERDMAIEENKGKKRRQDPARKKAGKEAYKTNWNLRNYNLRRSLNSRKYTVISNHDINDMLKAYPEWEDQDIAEELIERYNEGNLDSDIPDEDEARQRELEYFTGLEAFYNQKAYEEYLEQLEIEAQAQTT